MNSPTVHPCWSGIFPGLFSLWRHAPVWGYRGPPAPQLWPRCLESQPQHSNDKVDRSEDGAHTNTHTQLECNTEHRCSASPHWPARFVHTCVYARYPSSSHTRASPNTADCLFGSLQIRPCRSCKSREALTRHRWLNSCQQQIRRGRKCREPSREQRSQRLRSSSLSAMTPQRICTAHGWQGEFSSLVFRV